MPEKPSCFLPPIARLTIGSLDEIEMTVTAQYNPSQIEVARTVGWKSLNPDNTPSQRRPEPSGNDVEFTGGQGRTLSLELLFDGFETGTCVSPMIDLLDRMATPRDATSNKEELRRPHQCVVVWGDYVDLPADKSQRVTPKSNQPFRCVIDSLSVKYTVFAGDGRPLRATVSVKVREAQVKRPGEPDDARAKKLATTQSKEADRYDWVR